MNIIPFDGGKGNLPAYLKKVDVSALNSDLTSHAGGGFPVISIKGKQFAVVRDGERKVLPNPKDPDSPATSIDVVLIKANAAKSKVFYLKGYDPKESEGKKPDCFSNNGSTPDASVEHPQSKSCATCVHNQWGAKIGENGKKGKACSDSVRVAVAAAGQVNDPMLLRVPPASIKALGEYGQMLAKRGVGYNMVVTKVGFDVDAESPKLTFKPVGLLDDAGFAEVQSTAESDIVRDILGAAPVTVHEMAAALAAPTEEAEEEEAPRPAAKTKTVSDEEVSAAVNAAVKKATKAATKPAAVVQDLDVELDGINFDDE